MAENLFQMIILSRIDLLQTIVAIATQSAEDGDTGPVSLVLASPKNPVDLISKASHSSTEENSDLKLSSATKTLSCIPTMITLH